MEILKVSSKSNPNSVAGAMAGVVRQAGVVEVQVVGAGALNQAIKAVAIARNYVASAGLDLVCSPTFADISIDGEDRTGIHLLVETRSRDGAANGAHADGARFGVTAASLVGDVRIDGGRTDGAGARPDLQETTPPLAGSVSAPATEAQPPILQG